jgi:hypothetical protein
VRTRPKDRRQSKLSPEVRAELRRLRRADPLGDLDDDEGRSSRTRSREQR